MNYKIRITAENQAIVKRIADENNMNRLEFQFSEFQWYYIIKENEFWTNMLESDYPELTTEQFIEMFDKKETKLDKWLRETKAKNLSLEELKNIISFQKTCPPNEVWSKLTGENNKEKAQILFNQWNNPTEESPKVETEWQPKRGDRVLVWDNFSSSATERIFLTEIKGTPYPIIVVNKNTEKEFINNETFNTVCFKCMKPLPTENPKENKVEEAAKKLCELQEGTYTTQHKVTYQHGFIDGAKWQSEQPKETDFKSKVIELIEKRIECYKHRQSNIGSSYIRILWENSANEAQELLNQIKQL
jgi:hypothetical protein